jgi:argininosuccinate lyase
MRRFAPEFTGDFAALLDPKKGMRSREIAGGTGPEAVAGALQAARQKLAGMTL